MTLQVTCGRQNDVEKALAAANTLPVQALQILNLQLNGMPAHTKAWATAVQY